jgi:hypothetical protein
MPQELIRQRFRQRIDTDTVLRKRAESVGTPNVGAALEKESAFGFGPSQFYCLPDVTRCRTNSCRTLMATLVPRAMPAFSKVSAAP